MVLILDTELNEFWEIPEEEADIITDIAKYLELKKSLIPRVSVQSTRSSYQDYQYNSHVGPVYERDIFKGRYKKLPNTIASRALYG